MKRECVALFLLGLAGAVAWGGGFTTGPVTGRSGASGRGPVPAAVAPVVAVPEPQVKAIGDTWTNGIGMKFTYIPAGEFLMGSPDKEASRHDDEKQHTVKLSKPFLMGVYEVTQGEWKSVMGSNPSFFAGDDKMPVEEVSWTNANTFCQRMGGRDGQKYRLPTEAEWEYACRAGTTTPFNTGETLNPDQANFNGKFPYGAGKPGAAHDKPLPVGSFKPNAWGLYDMHGNVWEWCSDWLMQYPEGPATDPTGPGYGGATNAAWRVMRGGSFGYLPDNCRSAVRNGAEEKSLSSGVGLRVVMELKSIDGK